MKRLIKSGKIVIIYDNELEKDLVCKVLQDIDRELVVEGLYSYRDLHGRDNISIIEFLFETGHIKVFQDIEEISFDI
jgi:hypothetical protein